MHFAFTSEHGSVVECEVDFADGDFGNLNFLDQPRQDILLHLSLRHARQVLVHNRHIDGAWVGAKTVPVALEESSNTLRVTFHGDHAIVHVNGAKAGRFDLPESLLGGPEPCHWVRAVGGVRHVRLSGPAHEQRAGRGVMTLARPFVLEGWAFDPAAEEQRITVTVGEGGDTLPPATLPLAMLADPERAREQRAPTERIGLRAIVPGWIWDGLPAETEEVPLQLLANGRPCGAPVQIRRSDATRMVEEVCARAESASEFELLSALEHDRFAGLGPRLTSDARAALAAAAERLGARSFHLPVPDAPIKPPTLHGPVPTARAGAASEALASLDPVPRVLRRISHEIGLAPPERWADLLRADGLDDLARPRLRDLLLVMAGAFCRADRFEDLHELCADFGLQDMPTSFGTWATALTQPFLYVQERGADMHASLRSIVDFNGWVDQNALCWAATRLLRARPPFVAEHQRDDIADAILSYVERHPNAAHNAPTGALLATMLAEAEAFCDEFRDTLTGRVLGVQGLSRQFWDAIEREAAEGRLTLSPRLSAERARFGEIEDAIAQGDPVRAQEALRGCHAGEAPRVARELFVAARAAGSPAEDVLDRAMSDQWLGSAAEDDSLLRLLAFPGDGADLPDHAAWARRVIRRRHANVPRALHPDQQQAAGAAARRLLTGAGDGRDADLAKFAAAAQSCGRRRDDYLGAGLLVALVSGAQMQADDGLAAEVERHLDTLLREYRDDEREALTSAPAVQMALWGLRRTQGIRPGAAGARTLERFDSVLADLPPGADVAGGSAPVLSPRTGLAAFHDVLVVVYSCQPYLETRLPAMRAAWLDDLDAAGIPWIVAVGGGDGTLDGHVLSLDAPDSYEGLPQKSVALFEWLRANSGFAHIYKIDDDCYLDAERAIGGLSYRRHDYFGRRLTLRPGQMDRLWHQGRSASPAAAREIDKSPEPSEYADGGAGYVLNRRALEALHHVWQSAEGAWLRLVSFMEDKLVGDTLACAGIRPSNRDYHACILRRSAGNGPIVSRWEHGFLPSAASPTLVAHLDHLGLQAKAARIRRGAALEPRRIWPTSQTVRVGQGDVCLDLVSPQARLDRVNAAPVCVVAGMRNEMQMLPMFLDHYRKLGVDGFLIVDNASEDGTLAYLAEQEDVAAFSSDAPYSKTEYGVVWQRALVANFRLGRWSLVADCDEFLVLPDGVASLPELLAGEDFAAADAGRAFMLDMYPAGPLAEATLRSGDPFAELTHCERAPFLNAWDLGPYANDETWTSALRHRLLPGSRRELFVAQKYALMRYRPWMRFTAGLHYASDLRLARRELVFAHFKYHAGFHERVRIETTRREHFNDAEEYRKYLALLSEGRDVIHEPGISVPWRDSPWVRSVLAAGRSKAGESVSAVVPAQ